MELLFVCEFLLFFKFYGGPATTPVPAVGTIEVSPPPGPGETVGAVFCELPPGPPVLPEFPDKELPGPPFSAEPVVAMVPGASVTFPGLDPDEPSGAVGLIAPVS